MKKVLFMYLNARDHLLGVDYYRCVLPANALNRNSRRYKCYTSNGLIGKEGEQPEEVWTRMFNTYDIIFTKHIDTDRSLAQMMGARRFFKKSVVVDMDDDILHVDKTSPIYRTYFPKSAKLHVAKKSIEWADKVVCENEALKGEMYKLNKNIDVFRNYVNKDFAEDVHDNIVREDSKDIRILFSGGINHQQDVGGVLLTIKQILDKYKNVKFVFFGEKHLYDFWELPDDRMEIVKVEPWFFDYAYRLPLLNIDIGIAPLARTQFNRSKSPIKYFEYSMAGIPLIAQGYPPYSDVVKNGETGLLFQDNSELKEHLENLINNKKERIRLRENAYADVLENYDIDKHINKLEAILDDIS